MKKELKMKIGNKIPITPYNFHKFKYAVFPTLNILYGKARRLEILKIISKNQRKRININWKDGISYKDNDLQWLLKRNLIIIKREKKGILKKYLMQN